MTTPSVEMILQPSVQMRLVLTSTYLDVTEIEDVRQAVDTYWRDDLMRIEIDCAQVEFVDSSGVGMLVGLHKRLGGGGPRVVLRNVKPAIRSVFALLCLEDLFEFV